jgi:hypothetical protein
MQTCQALYTASELEITAGVNYNIVQVFSDGSVEIISDSGQSSHVPEHMIIL